MPENLALLFLTLAFFMAAGFVKGVVGLGLPTLALGLLGLVMVPSQAVAMLVVPSIITNVWQLAVGPHLVSLMVRLWSLLLMSFIATLAGLWTGFLTADSGHAAMALGSILIVYGVLGLTPLRFSVSPPMELWLSPLIGVATGLVSAGTGVFSVPSVPYLEALGLRRDELVQALGLFFSVCTCALAIGLWHQGAMKLSVAGASLLALFPALAGMALGQWVGKRIRPAVFRTCFFIVLIGLGAHLAGRAMF